jgi:hypothetical protein
MIFDMYARRLSATLFIICACDQGSHVESGVKFFEAVIQCDLFEVWYYFFLSFTLIVDCVLSITGTFMLLFFVVEAGLIGCLHGSTKILSHTEKCLFLMYFFFTLNSNMFPEFLYHPHLSRCSQTM